MRIGLLIYGSLDTLSGGYLYDRKLVEYLRRQGDELRIISLPWRNYAAHLGDNLRFRLPPGLDMLIEDELNHPSLLAANRHKPYPVVSLVHHLRCSEGRPRWQNTFYRIVERRYLSSVDGFIFNSQTTRSVVTGLVGERRPSLIAYPPTDRFGQALPVETVRARAAEGGPLRLLFLGNVIPRKGLDTVLKALLTQRTRRNTKETPLFTLDVVGSLAADPAYARRMQQLASVLGSSSPVRFHGALDEAALAAQLRQAQVLVVPSSYEGFGIVYLEGMAFGLPAIGSTAGAASEIIRPGETGYLIAPGDAGMLAAHLAALATDRNLLAQLALNALERYKQQPPWEQTAGEIWGFLKKMRGWLLLSRFGH